MFYLGKVLSHITEVFQISVLQWIRVNLINQWHVVVKLQLIFILRTFFVYYKRRLPWYQEANLPMHLATPTNLQIFVKLLLTNFRELSATKKKKFPKCNNYLSTSKQFTHLLCHGPEVVAPYSYTSFTGACRPRKYGFGVVLVWNWIRDWYFIPWNRVRISRNGLHLSPPEKEYPW